MKSSVKNVINLMVSPSTSKHKKRIPTATKPHGGKQLEITILMASQNTRCKLKGKMINHKKDDR
jgi:hypothetical protein